MDQTAHQCGTQLGHPQRVGVAQTDVTVVV
jgi:hypothetical protein